MKERLYKSQEEEELREITDMRKTLSWIVAGALALPLASGCVSAGKYSFADIRAIRAGAAQENSEWKIEESALGSVLEKQTDFSNFEFILPDNTLIYGRKTLKYNPQRHIPCYFEYKLEGVEQNGKRKFLLPKDKKRYEVFFRFLSEGGIVFD